MADEAGFFSQRDAVREYTRLARASEAIFVALGSLAPRLPSSADTAAAATLARQMGAHAVAWAELVPESVLLAEARSATEPLPVLDGQEPAVRAAVASLRADLESLLARTSPTADGAARRLARAVLHDLDRSADPSLG